MSGPVSRLSKNSRLTVSRSPSVDASQRASQPQQSGSVQCGMPEDDDDLKKKGDTFWADIKDDWHNIAILTLLYILQGIPLGLAGLAPFLLTEKGVGMTALATFSMCVFPYSIKVLWAPIVDSVFFSAVGRRKTWLIPSQLLIGILLIIAPIQRWVEDLEISSLTVLFVVLYFCAATQDVAVDGWALEILSRKNVSLASPCNTAGQTLGMFIASSGYLLLSSNDMATLDQFSQFSGLCFIIVTTCIWIFKKEDPPEGIEDFHGSYKLMWKMFKLPAVRSMVGQFWFAKAPFGLASVAVLQIQEGGVSKEKIAVMNSVLTMVLILFPALAANWFKNIDGMTLFDKMYIPRLLLGPVAVALAAMAPSFAHSPGYLAVVFIWLLFDGVLATGQFISQMSFFNKVSDPMYGGTYMTFLNTIANIAAFWPIPFSLRCSSYLGFGTCSFIMLTVSTFWYVVFGKAGFKKLSALRSEDWLVRPDVEGDGEIVVST